LSTAAKYSKGKLAYSVNRATANAPRVSKALPNEDEELLWSKGYLENNSRISLITTTFSFVLPLHVARSTTVYRLKSFHIFSKNNNGTK